MADVSRHDCSISPSVPFAEYSIITHCLTLIKSMPKCVFIPIIISEPIVNRNFHRICTSLGTNNDGVITKAGESNTVGEGTTFSWLESLKEMLEGGARRLGICNCEKLLM